jgi:hypothetical protein
MMAIALELDRPSLFDDWPRREADKPAPAATPAAARAPARSAPPRPPRSGGATLDDIVVGAWEGLAAHRPVACPVCGGSMAPRYGSAAEPVGGRCGRCGSSLG